MDDEQFEKLMKTISEGLWGIVISLVGLAVILGMLVITIGELSK